MTRHDDKIVQIRKRESEGSSPRSCTQPIARKVSSTDFVPPRAGLERLVLVSTEGAMRALRDAAEASRQGEAGFAAELRGAAEMLLEQARAALDVLGGDI
jgi:hypothetical protein